MTKLSKGVSDAGKHINMDAATIAKIFDGKITKWNDPAIADQNKDLKLPDTAITVVHRSDKSGTTQNFVSYFRIIVDDMMEYASTSRCGAGINVSFRPGFSEALVDAVVQEFAVPLDRCIGTDFLRCKFFKCIFDYIQYNQIAIFIKNRTYRAIDHFIIADFLSQCNGPVICCENIIFRTLSLCMRCCQTEHK